MLFRKKCSNCGAKNPKDVTACAGCGAPFELKQMAVQKTIKNYGEVLHEKTVHPNLMDTDACNTRGNRYLEQRQLGRAIEEFGEAIRLDPKYAVAYGNRAMAYKLQGNKIRAIADFEKFIALTPDPRLIQIAKQQVEELATK
ncbi:MAG: tetratricopeptide repeat protein [Dehalococcoidales bacterium]|jgi:tetratricopeptide (TPR) repeat protein|nr:tetratricopeptide repeat protein [Dehalococcoidales bacterium]